jgi:hypothetical protein
MRVLRPRVTDMLNDTFRPEVVICGVAESAIAFLEPMVDADAAWERACDAVEIVPGDWTDSGRWYVCP